MIALWITLGSTVPLLALAALAWCLGYLIRSVGHLAQSVAVLLPSGGTFVAAMAELRDQQVPQTSVQLPQAFGAVAPQVPWPTRRERGLAPPPVDTTSATDASFPATPPGDHDIFNPDVVEMLRQAERTRAVTPAEGER